MMTPDSYDAEVFDFEEACLSTPSEAWDCALDPEAFQPSLASSAKIPEDPDGPESDDWQPVVQDRFGDRLVSIRY